MAEKTVSVPIYSNKALRKKGEHLLQLREEPDGKGILFIDCSRTVRLNESATELAKAYLEGVGEDKAVSRLRKKYAVNKQTAKSDWDHITKLLAGLGDGDPLEDLGATPAPPGTLTPSSPLVAHVALSYDDPAQPYLDFSVPGREIRGLIGREWEVAMQRLIATGVHYVIFYGGEPTAQEILPSLVSQLSNSGIGVGLETNGLKLRDQKYLASLVSSGLDSVIVKLSTCDPTLFYKLQAPKAKKGSFSDIGDGIKAARKLGLEVLVRIYMTKETLPTLLKTAEYVKGLGVTSLLLSFIPNTNPDVFRLSHIESIYLDVVWDQIAELAKLGMNVNLTTPLEPTEAQELLQRTQDISLAPCKAAGMDLAIEPSGDILPCRHVLQPVGNILTVNWQKMNADPNWSRTREAAVQARGLGLCSGCPWKVYFPDDDPLDWPVTEERGDD